MNLTGNQIRIATWLYYFTDIDEILVIGDFTAGKCRHNNIFGQFHLKSLYMLTEMTFGYNILIDCR